MIRQTIEQAEGISLVQLSGCLDDEPEADRVARRILESHQPGDMLIIDLTEVDVTHFKPIAWLVLDLEASPHWREIRLVEHRVDSGRQLRSTTHRLPVFPDASAARGEPSSATPA